MKFLEYSSSTTKEGPGIDIEEDTKESVLDPEDVAGELELDESENMTINEVDAKMMTKTSLNHWFPLKDVS